jgi:sec-independent protein translocase protein TatB
MIILPRIEVASLGMWDSLILMIMALVVFGPRRLPEIGRQIGKLMYELRKVSTDFKIQIEEELRNAEDADRRRKQEEQQRALAAPAAMVTSEETTPPAEATSAVTSEETTSPAEATSAVTSEETTPPATTAPAVESPYPGEGTYPEAYPPETPAAESVTPETAVEATTTTEPVQADPAAAGSSATDQTVDSGSSPAEPATGAAMAAKEPGATLEETIMEPVNRNG